MAADMGSNCSRRGEVLLLLPHPCITPHHLSLPLQDRLVAVNEVLQKYMKKLRERTTHHMG